MQTQPVASFSLFFALSFILSNALMTGASAREAQASVSQADAVFLNGNFYTANPRQTWASAVAIQGDRILYVGDEAGAAELVGPETTQYRLNGKLVLPGLIDAHTHPGYVAQSVGNVWIADAKTQAELMRAIAEMVKSNPDRPVLMGGFWRNELFTERGPHKRDLDRIESSRPVILYDWWGHSVWANSKALERAGVDRNTPDVIPGLAYYQRDANGEPTGWITESAASVFANHFRSITPASSAAGLHRGACGSSACRATAAGSPSPTAFRGTRPTAHASSSRATSRPASVRGTPSHAPSKPAWIPVGSSTPAERTRHELGPGPVQERPHPVHVLSQLVPAHVPGRRGACG